MTWANSAILRCSTSYGIMTRSMLFNFGTVPGIRPVQVIYLVVQPIATVCIYTFWPAKAYTSSSLFLKLGEIGEKPQL